MLRMLVDSLAGQACHQVCLAELGSHAWVSFVTAVERIEANAPGATATMSYAQVMLHAGIAPVTAQEHRVEYLAQNAALKHWAVINGMGLPATDDAMHAVLLHVCGEG